MDYLTVGFQFTIIDGDGTEPVLEGYTLPAGTTGVTTTYYEAIPEPRVRVTFYVPESSLPVTDETYIDFDASFVFSYNGTSLPPVTATIRFYRLSRA